MVGTADDLQKKIADLKFEALRNAIYHTARRGVMDTLNRIFSFLVIVSGAAAVGDLGQKFGVTPQWLAFVAAMAGTTQLVADFGVVARNHEFLQRQFYELIAEIAAVAEPNASQVAAWEAKLNRIYGEEPPPMRALDAIAYNAACESLGRQDSRVRVTWWQSALRHVLMFTAASFPYEQRV
jgi:hypothetical protein